MTEMNFEKVPPVENSGQLLDLAFGRAREKSRQKNLKGNWLQIIRSKECIKLDIIKDALVLKLDRILKGFPDISHLPEFYIKLMKVTLDYPELKKSLGAVNWGIQRIRILQREYVSKITKCKDRGKINELAKQFYGRISSTLKQISPNLNYLEQSRRIMRTYPDIKEKFTVCIYGFPNVGKTTLLNKLTGTQAKVAAYAFTTKSINVGYIKGINGGDVINAKDANEIQVLDVPGTLARPEKMNNIEFQADLVMRELANLIIFVFDHTEQCGYSLKKQELLLKKLSGKNVLIYLSKTDLHKPLKFKYKFYSIEELKEEILKRLKGQDGKR